MRVCRKFRAKLLADEWQCAHLLQHLSRHGITCKPASFSGGTMQQLATLLLGVFRDRAIDLYNHEQLIRDLKRLEVEEKSYGWRLTSPRVKGEGHGDVASAFALALLAFERLPPRVHRQPRPIDVSEYLPVQ